MSKVIILGNRGQLGTCLHDTQPAGFDVVGVDIDELDITDPVALAQYLASQQAEWVLNAAAYTAVDKAEEESELAYRVNYESTRFLAEACAKHDTKLVHISTDFVFDGEKRSPYQPGDNTRPLGVYGASKLAGEDVVRKVLPEDSIIIRTAWLYSEYGNNFVKTMISLMKNRDELGVVADQKGTPTYARGLATVIWQLVSLKASVSGVFHWTDNGETSWHGFASEIQLQARKNGFLSKEIPIKALTTSEYPTPAKRPAYSVLDSSELQELTGNTGAEWKSQLADMLQIYKAL